MTSDALPIDAVEREALQHFAFLMSDHGFAGPVMRRGPFSLSIDYLQEAIAIELAFDWRDTALSVLLVRLENGELPDGYYVSNGRRCRVYLTAWLARNGRFEPVTDRRLGRRHSSQVAPLDAMKEQIAFLSNLVSTNIEFIQEHAASAFEA